MLADFSYTLGIEVLLTLQVCYQYLCATCRTWYNVLDDPDDGILVVTLNGVGARALLLLQSI